MIDDIIARINREDELEHQERMRKVEETRAIVADFQQERILQKEALERERREQEAEIKAYDEMMTQRTLKEEAERKRTEEEKKRRWKKVVEETRNQTQSKEELDTLRAMLWEEELEAKRKKEEEDATVKYTQQKEIMMRENKAQIAAKREMLEQMEREERELVDRMLKKFAEDADDERRKEENRRAFKERFMAEANQQRLDRRAMVHDEKQRVLKERDILKEQEEYKQRVINEARRKLLEQHAAQLRGFLPTKVDV